ncbi:hypothetical protein [Streptomyces halobius]|uniref:Uncharacterized protein n=1 Tax=Streptomyces halobius TaxID=2879846 RepID=A0ABY4MGW4_9ACTN|nr:hypothetical protein [Streptomyces halobius]UQA97041.1 hypothetical protein K9S39_38840 [Streptomyces halobius]
MVQVRDVVRDVVAEHAAHELPLVDSLRQFDDDRVIRTLARRGRRREPLGFGYAEAAALVTPVVWLVLDQAARRGVDAATERLMRRGRTRLRRLLRRAPGTPDRVLIELARDELALVRTHILERATERGIDRREAEALADGVVARLATTAHDEGEGHGGGRGETQGDGQSEGQGYGQGEGQGEGPGRPGTGS